MRGSKHSVLFTTGLIGLVSIGQAEDSCAEEVTLLASKPIETGMALRFMPVGWFDLADPWNRSFSAFPALGFAPFIDYRISRYFSLGFSPEITLNVIPNRIEYQVGKMLVADVRLQARYPNQGRFEPYGILMGGYSVIWLADNGGSAKGPAVGGMAGCRVKIGNRNAIFAETGYQKGFQKLNGGAYGPSYVITSAGWQVAF